MKALTVILFSFFVATTFFSGKAEAKGILHVTECRGNYVVAHLSKEHGLAESVEATLRMTADKKIKFSQLTTFVSGFAFQVSSIFRDVDEIELPASLRPDWEVESLGKTLREVKLIVTKNGTDSFNIQKVTIKFDGSTASTQKVYTRTELEGLSELDYLFPES